MPKLHQILAVEADIRNQATKDLTAIYHDIQKAELLQGLTKDYQPVKEDGEKHPTERKALAVRAKEKLSDAQKILQRQFDIVATRDVTNCGARADLVLEDGTVLAKQLPSMYLLWLEKKLEELHAVVMKLPTLSADVRWQWEPNQNCYTNADEIKQRSTSKIDDVLVLYNATKEFAAQTAKITKDVTAGHWTTKLFSGALPIPDVKAFKERVEALAKAVKMAREAANQVEIVETKVGGPILDFVFGNLTK